MYKRQPPLRPHLDLGDLWLERVSAAAGGGCYWNLEGRDKECGKEAERTPNVGELLLRASLLLSQAQRELSYRKVTGTEQKWLENLHEGPPNLAISQEWSAVHVCRPSMAETEAGVSRVQDNAGLT